MKNDHARYKLILSVTSEGFWDWNLKTDQAYLSPRYCELVGYSPHDTTFDRRFFESIIHPGDRAKVSVIMGECLQGKREMFLIEYRMVSRDGTIRWIEGRGRIVGYDDQGKPDRMVGTIVDISERKKAEELHNHTQNLITAIFEDSPFAFFVKDVKGKFRIILWNREAERIFGIPSANILGKTSHDIWPRDQADDFLKDDLAVVSSRDMLDLPENTFSHHKRGIIHLHIRKIPLFDQDGKVSHLVVICEDISERHRMEAERAKNQKLESLGVLVKGIAHDFNNIFTTIIGNISYARMFIDESHKSITILRDAEEAVSHAAGLALQLLTFAKDSKPIRGTIPLQCLLEDSVSFALHGSNVSCDINITDETLEIDADKSQISQVINNVIINAAQSMPDGGKTVVTAEITTLDASNIMSLAPGKYIRITVADTGCGISDENLKRIFDPYFTTKAKCSGLGLALAHSIVTNHGGYIGVKSVVDKGSTFDILLPASDKSNMHYEIGTDPAESSGQNGYSVLVMDDEIAIRNLLTKMLNSLGYYVQTCTSGEEAISLYKDAWETGSPFSAVIVDLTIPGGVGGKETAQRILAIDSAARLIVTSGFTIDPVVTKYQEHGFCAALLKPYSIGKMANFISGVLAAGR